MKNNFLYVLLVLLIPVCSPAQKLTPFVVSSSGGFYENSSGMLSFTTGELMIETFSNPTNILTQGFQQAWEFSTAVKVISDPGFEFLIFPNPSSGHFELITESEKNIRLNIEVFDILGRKLLQNDLYHENGFHTMSLDLSEASEGTYLVFLTITEHTSNNSSQVIEKIQIIR